MGEGLESRVVNPAVKKILNVPSPKGGGGWSAKKTFFYSSPKEALSPSIGRKPC